MRGKKIRLPYFSSIPLFVKILKPLPFCIFFFGDFPLLKGRGFVEFIEFIETF